LKEAATINASLSSVKVYAEKATLAELMTREQYLAIKGVAGLREKEADRIDAEREQQEKPTRKGSKKSEPTYLSPFLLEQLFARPDTSLAQRDRWTALEVLTENEHHPCTSERAVGASFKTSGLFLR
jgi:hypothetical protein